MAEMTGTQIQLTVCARCESVKGDCDSLHMLLATGHIGLNSFFDFDLFVRRNKANASTLSKDRQHWLSQEAH